MSSPDPSHAADGPSAFSFPVEESDDLELSAQELHDQALRMQDFSVKWVNGWPSVPKFCPPPLPPNQRKATKKAAASKKNVLAKNSKRPEKALPKKKAGEKRPSKASPKKRFPAVPLFVRDRKKGSIALGSLLEGTRTGSSTGRSGTEGSECDDLSESGTKHERSEDEEPTRRVARRIDDSAANPLENIVDIVSSSSDEAVLEEAMKKLLDQVTYDDKTKRSEQQRAFLQIDGHMVVVRVMNEHPHCKILQEYGMRVLRRATYKNDEVKEAVGKVKGVHAIVAAMMQYVMEKSTQFHGLGAIYSMIVLPTNAEVFVTELDGASLIVESMNRFSGNKNIVEEACILLKKLCHMKNLRKAIDEANAVSALANAYDCHKKNEAIRVAARGALNRLTRV